MSAASKLKACFNSPFPDEYLHFLAKNEKDSSVYENPKVLEKIQAIRQKLGEDAFDRQAAHGWTPVHVAVLSQNTAALKFLLNEGAKIDIPDESQKIPVMYAENSPEIMKILMTSPQSQALSERSNFHSHEEAIQRADQLFDTIISNYFSLPSIQRNPQTYRLPFPSPPLDLNQVKQVCLGLLAPIVCLPDSFTYQENTNDFGLELRKLLFVQPKNIQMPVNHMIEDLTRIGAVEGFELDFPAVPHFPRDAFITTPRGVTSFAHHTKELGLALDRTNSKSAYFGESAPFCARMRCILGHLGMTAGEKHLADSHHLASYRESRLPVYIEGGNFFTLSNSRGERKVFIGADHLVQMHAQLRLQKYFETHVPEALVATPSDTEIEACVEEMYAMGLIFSKTEKGYITMDQISDVLPELYKAKEIDRLSFRKAAISKGFISPFDQKHVKDSKDSAIKYLAQRRSLVKALAQECGADPQDICFIPHVAYHLDVFMQPGPKGSIFLQDFDVCIKVLETLLEYKTHAALHLGLDDRFILKRYLAMARQLAKELGPLLKETREKLEKAGFIVIPAPGIFFDQHIDLEDQTFHINFFNAVTGWSEKNDRYFYITTGTSVGTKLGACMMEIFKNFLGQYEQQLAVYFVGENPDKKGDFSQAMRCWNNADQENKKRAAMAGIHCMSIEKELKSHKHTVPKQAPSVP